MKKLLNYNRKIPRELVQKLLDDHNLLLNVKIENYLLVWSGLKPCSLLTIPTELKDYGKFVNIINARFYPKILSLSNINDAQIKEKEVAIIRSGMRITESIRF